jgi:hypothetical protein
MDGDLAGWREEQAKPPPPPPPSTPWLLFL